MDLTFIAKVYPKVTGKLAVLYKYGNEWLIATTLTSDASEVYSEPPDTNALNPLNESNNSDIDNKNINTTDDNNNGDPAIVEGIPIFLKSFLRKLFRTLKRNFSFDFF